MILDLMLILDGGFVSFGVQNNKTIVTVIVSLTEASHCCRGLITVSNSGSTSLHVWLLWELLLASTLPGFFASDFDIKH